MKLVFFTLTGQTRRFVAKLDMAEQVSQLTPAGLDVTENFILLCPTYESGVDYVADFLASHKQLCKGIIGLGNRNFGPDFCHLAKSLTETYQLPLLYTLEFNGTPEDVEHVKGIIENES